MPADEQMDTESSSDSSSSRSSSLSDDDDDDDDDDEAVPKKVNRLCHTHSTTQAINSQ